VQRIRPRQQARFAATQRPGDGLNEFDDRLVRNA